MTTPSLTPEMLAEIREALARATPGPWVAQHEPNGDIHVVAGAWPFGSTICERPSEANASLIELLHDHAPALLSAAESAHTAEQRGRVAGLREAAEIARRQQHKHFARSGTDPNEEAQRYHRQRGATFFDAANLILDAADALAAGQPQDAPTEAA